MLECMLSLAAVPQVVAAKAGTGSATLSMAYAAARFAESCLRAQAGESGVTEYGYVQVCGNWVHVGLSGICS